MSKCKRCHAPDELNGIGLCKHCTSFIKNDVKESKERLSRIYDQFPEGADLLDEARKGDFLRETQEIFTLLDRYQHMGFPVGSYIMPVRKILHFLEPGGDTERRILLKQRRRAGITAIICAATAAAFVMIAAMLGNQPLPVKLGDAVSVSASIEHGMEQTAMDEAGMSDAGMEGLSEGDAAEGESPMDGGGEVSDGDESSDASDTMDEEASSKAENSDEANENPAPAPSAPRVSTNASGGTVIFSGGAVAIPVG